jgi:hypothetical protein
MCGTGRLGGSAAALALLVHASTLRASAAVLACLSIRVRVEIMGSQTCGIVGKSQPVLIMIDPIISSSPAPVCSGGAGARPEWALLDSQNKVSSTTEGRAVSLLVRCMRGEESLLQSVLRQRLAPLVVS